MGCSRYRFMFHHVSEVLCQNCNFVNWAKDNKQKYEVSNAIIHNNMVLGYFTHYGVAQDKYIKGWNHHKHAHLMRGALYPNSVHMINSSVEMFEKTFACNSTSILFSSFTWDIMRYLNLKNNMSTHVWASDYQKNVTSTLNMLSQNKRRKIILDIPFAWDVDVGIHIIQSANLYERLQVAAIDAQVDTLQTRYIVNRSVLHQKKVESLHMWNHFCNIDVGCSNKNFISNGNFENQLVL